MSVDYLMISQLFKATFRFKIHSSIYALGTLTIVFLGSDIPQHGPNARIEQL